MSLNLPTPGSPDSPDSEKQASERGVATRRVTDAADMRRPATVLLPSFSGTSSTGPLHGATEDPELTLAQLLHIVRRRWAVALPIFVLSVAAALWQFNGVTPVYEAVTTIRIDKAKEALPGISSNPMMGYTSPYELSTEMQVIQSRAIARDVASRTAFALRVVEPRLPRSELLDSVELSSGALAGDYTLSGVVNGTVTARGPSGATSSAKVGEWLSLEGMRLRTRSAVLEHPEVLLTVLGENSATGAMKAALKVTQPVRDAEVLRLTVRDPDPHLAARLADAVAEVFTESQTSRRQAGGRTTVAFIRAQLDTLDQQLREAEVTLRDWRASAKVVVPGAEASNAVARRAEYEQRVAERRLELENIEALLELNSQGREVDPAARMQRGFRTVLSSSVMKGSPAASSILSTLLELEAKRADLRLRRTAEDPDVKVLDKTIADYERQGQLFVGSYTSALRTEIAGYERGLGSMGARLARFPGQELDLTTLQRNAEVLATLQGTLRTRLKEAEITNASNAPNVELLDRASPPTMPVAPVLSRYMGIGVFAGLILAVMGAIGRERMDRTIHSREDAERAAGVPLIGLIPSFAIEEGARSRMPPSGRLSNSRKTPSAPVTVQAPEKAVVRGKVSNVIAVNVPRHVASEAYRVLRTNLRFAPADQPRQVLTVTSPSPGDGKSTTTLNYAATLAVQGRHVLLIDADMRRGTQHKKLGVLRTPGLSGILAGRASREAAVQTVLLGDSVSLDLIASGDSPPNPAELLGGASMSALLAWAKANYDTVLIDTPPVNIFADGLLLAAAADATLLVCRAGKSFKEEVAMAAEQLRKLNAPIAGVLLNDYNFRRDSPYGNANYYYDRSYYKYYAAYATADDKDSAA